MIVLIRISGCIKIKQDAAETLGRLRLRKKYACAIVPEKPEILGMVKKVRNFIAYGKMDEKTLVELIKARGKKLGRKNIRVENPEEVAKGILAGKSPEELKIKPWFGLHPARGGIDTKHHYPKGVLGNHGDKINELIMRML